MDTFTGDDIPKINDAIKNEVDDVITIYLFGSIARGNEKKHSDYDILVIVREYPKNVIKTISNIRNNVSTMIHRPIEVFFMTPEDLNYPSPLLYEVFMNNIVLYGNNILKTYKNVIDRMTPKVRNGTIIGYYVRD